jgi:hypothetical protein
MLFAPGLQRAFATHPPLIERIRAIDPRFQPSEFGEVQRRLDAKRAAAEAEAKVGAGGSPDAAARLRSLLGDAVVLGPAAVTGLVANPGTEHVLQAQLVLESLPESFERAARQPAQAAALFLALAIDAAPEARGQQLAYIRQQLGDALHGQVTVMLAETDALSAVQRMPALLQVFAALAQLGRDERVALLKCLNGLMVRESRASAFGYALRKLAQVQLRDNLDPRRRAAGHLSAQGARDELRLLFSVIAAEGHADGQAARPAYDAGIASLLPGLPPPMLDPGHWPPKLDAALSRLDRLRPEAKEKLVAALVTAISHDGRMTVPESELLRAICAVLHCPLPPLYAARQAGQTPASRGASFGPSDMSQ